MRKQISILLVLVFSISVIGCGSVNAKNDNVNANMTDAVTNNDAQADTEKISEVSVPETKTDFKLFSKGYSGSVYTLPVGSKDEAWTEAQLDAYLADCKPYIDNCAPNEKGLFKVDVDQLMKDFGFEYVGTNDENYYSVKNVYWKERGDLKIVAVFTDSSHLRMLFESGSSCAETVFHGSMTPGDQIVRFRSEHINGGNEFPKTTVLHLKAIVACLKYATQEDVINCCKMPYPEYYELKYGTFSLSKSERYVSDSSVSKSKVYY